MIVSALKHLQSLDVVIHFANFSTAFRAWTCATLAVMSAMLCERTELTEWISASVYLCPVSTSFATWLDTSWHILKHLETRYRSETEFLVETVVMSLVPQRFACEDAIEKKRQSFVNASQNGFKVIVQIPRKGQNMTKPTFFGVKSSDLVKMMKKYEENRQKLNDKDLCFKCCLVLISSIFFAIDGLATSRLWAR